MLISIVKLVIILIIIIWGGATNWKFMNNNKENYKNYKYGIAIACHNRPEYVKKSLESLKKSILKDVYICIIDDKSDDKKTIEIVKNFNIDGVKIEKIYSDKNEGIGKTLIKAFDILSPKCEYLIILDSDTLLNKKWLIKLQEAYDAAIKSDLNYDNYIVTGFNCQQSCSHKTIKEYDNFIVKKTIGGINMFFKKELYNKIFKDCLNGSGWDWCVCGKVKGFIATKPSTVQHIGKNGLFSGGGRYDKAEDFIAEYFFKGKKKGYVFTTRKNKTGYYRDK